MKNILCGITRRRIFHFSILVNTISKLVTGAFHVFSIFFEVIDFVQVPLVHKNWLNRLSGCSVLGDMVCSAESYMALSLWHTGQCIINLRRVWRKYREQWSRFWNVPIWILLFYDVNSRVPWIVQVLFRYMVISRIYRQYSDGKSVIRFGDRFFALSMSFSSSLAMKKMSKTVHIAVPPVWR